ncbi:MAG: PilZ domain-containing protein [Candidatus Eremiobacteraeota bacterium]|nr:PilZ domain-containing protein [Candidatus Eremiobacteraeota bacterium]
MLSILGLRPRPPSDQLKLKLPQLNSFVALAMTGTGPRGSVCIESVTDRNFTVTALPGTSTGATGVFTYENTVGKFRFASKCVALRGGIATFAIPERIEALHVFAGAQQRSAVRLDATVSARWRFAPGGRGSGEFARASLTDISRTGASLIVDREIRRGTYLETCFSINPTAPPLVLLGEVMRSSGIESSKKISLGIRFNAVKPAEDRAITEFINKRQAERRNRGLA